VPPVCPSMRSVLGHSSSFDQWSTIPKRKRTRGVPVAERSETGDGRPRRSPQSNPLGRPSAIVARIAPRRVVALAMGSTGFDEVSSASLLATAYTVVARSDRERNAETGRLDQ